MMEEEIQRKQQFSFQENKGDTYFISSIYNVSENKHFRYEPELLMTGTISIIDKVT